MVRIHRKREGLDMLDLERIMQITKDMGIEVDENSNAKHKIKDFHGEMVEINKDTLKMIWNQGDKED